MSFGVAMSVTPAPLTASAAIGRRDALLLGVGFGCAIFLWVLMGTLTRPTGHLAAFWPANAVLLGLMVRLPQLANWRGWLIAIVAYLAAESLHSAPPLAIALLTLTNVGGAFAGYLVLSRLPEADQRLSRPSSVFAVIVVAMAGSLGAGLIAAMAEPVMVGTTVLNSGIFWFIGEMVNYVAILPVVLTLPAGRISRALLPWAQRRGRVRIGDWKTVVLQLLPVAALLVSGLAGVMVAGPGAVAFPVPALLWCAVSYRLFTVALLTLLSGAWTLMAIALGFLPAIADVNDRAMLMSVRVGVMLISLGPLVVASVMAARDELLQQLQFTASHDFLTGLFNRGAFLDQAEDVLSEMSARQRPFAVLMLDIDHFKAVNDTYGHAAGDLMLKQFARHLKASVREVDLTGRLGGEEFAALLVNCPPDRAATIAARIIAGFDAQSFALEDGRSIHATVSIGLVPSGGRDASIDSMLAAADAALYRAKESGRNRFEIASAAALPAM